MATNQGVVGSNPAGRARTPKAWSDPSLFSFIPSPQDEILQLRLVSLICLPVIGIALSACSGNSGPASSGQAPTASVRFVNAATRLGTVTFSVGAIQASVPVQTASHAFDVSGDSMTVTVTNGAMSASRAIPTGGVSQIDVIGYESSPGVLAVDSIAVGAGGSSSALLTYFNFGAVTSRPGDVYVVPDGTLIESAAPSFASTGGSLAFPPGTYNIVLTPRAGKTILFQSGPVALAAGQNLVLVAAPASAYVVTPQPIAIAPGQESRLLPDVRPQVTMFHRLDAALTEPPIQLAIDGDLIVEVPSVTAIPTITYHVTPGNRRFSPSVQLVATAFDFEIEPGKQYAETYGCRPFAFFCNDQWLWPMDTDFQVPPDKARVRLIVENNCRNNLVKVDGALINYGAQDFRNAGVLFDHASGPLGIEVTTPDGAFSEGALTRNLAAGRTYVIRIYGFASFRFGPPGWCLTGTPNPRTFEISSDE